MPPVPVPTGVPSLTRLGLPANTLVTNNKHSALKNDLMVRVLGAFPEYRAFQRALEARRRLGERPDIPWPEYPEKLQQAAEKCVDQLIRDTVDAEYKGTWVGVV